MDCNRAFCWFSSTYDVSHCEGEHFVVAPNYISLLLVCLYLVSQVWPEVSGVSEMFMILTVAFAIEFILMFGLGVVVETIKTVVGLGKFLVQPT